MKKTIYALLICSTLAVALPSLSVTSFAAPATATEATADEAASTVTARKPITRWYYSCTEDYMMQPTKNGLLTGFHVRRNK